MVVVTFMSLGLMLSISAYADSSKKGKVVCEGAACSSAGSFDLPAGVKSQNVITQTGNFISDLGDRVENRLQIANGAKNSKNPKSKKSAKSEKTKGETFSSAFTGGNLSIYYQEIDRSKIQASEKVVFVPKASDLKLKGMRSGDVVWAIVEQEITASPSVPTPVRALALSGQFKGGYFVGEATLDRELKRVLYNFTKFRLKDRDSVYSLRATGLSTSGSIGLEGEFVTSNGKFFAAEFASAAATGFVDSTITRNQTLNGGYAQEPSAANAGKSAAVSALAKTTERMAEAARSAPEYTHIDGMQEIQVIVQEDPVELGN